MSLAPENSMRDGFIYLLIAIVSFCIGTFVSTETLKYNIESACVKMHVFALKKDLYLHCTVFTEYPQTTPPLRRR